jgi:hypothetical protein
VQDVVASPGFGSNLQELDIHGTNPWWASWQPRCSFPACSGSGSA